MSVQIKTSSGFPTTCRITETRRTAAAGQNDLRTCQRNGHAPLPQVISVSAVPRGCHSAETVMLVISTSPGECSTVFNKAHCETSNQIAWNQVCIHQINKHYELMRKLVPNERWSPPLFNAQTYQRCCIYLLEHQGGIVSLALISPEPRIRSAFSFRLFKFLYRTYCNRSSAEIFKA